MRRTGSLEEPRGLEVHDHVCWFFDGRADFAMAAAAFLAEGLRQGQRVAYVADGDADQLEADLAPLGDVRTFLDSGRLSVTPVADMYPAGSVPAPERQVERFESLAAAAVADGFTGYRAAADVTRLVLTAEQRRSFLRYEHLIDRAIARHPLTGMCGFDRSVVGAEGADELASLHPLSEGAEPPFRLFTQGRGFGLAGEIDVADAEAFRSAIDQLADHFGRRVVVDVRQLGFVDHRGLDALEELGQKVDLCFSLRGASPMTQKLAAWLDLERVEVEGAA